MKNDLPSNSDEIILLCIDRLVEGEWSLDECLSRFPDHRETLLEELSFVMRLRDLQTVRPRPRFRRVARQRLQRRLQDLPSRTFSMNAPLQETSRKDRRSMSWATVAFAAFIIVLLIAGGTTAVLATADEAMPGDFLYELDLRLERRNLDSVNNLAESTDMNLRFSQERLKEAKSLADEGDAERAQIALAAHRQQLQETAEVVSQAEPESVDLGQLNNQLAAQSQELDTIYRQLAQLSDSQLSESAYCEEPTEVVHPAAVFIAELHDEDPGTITQLYCDGFEFGEVVLALVTLSEVNRVSPGARESVDLTFLLRTKDELGGWGLVWQELGEIGRRGTPPGQEGRPEEAPERPSEPGQSTDGNRGQGRQGQGRSDQGQGNQGQGNQGQDNQGQGNQGRDNQGQGNQGNQGQGNQGNQGQGNQGNQGQGNQGNQGQGNQDNQGSQENQGNQGNPGNQGQGNAPTNAGPPDEKEKD